MICTPPPHTQKKNPGNEPAAWGGFMKDFHFNTISNISQEFVQELQEFNCAYGIIGKSAVIKYHYFQSYKYWWEVVFWPIWPLPLLLILY